VIVVLPVLLTLARFEQEISSGHLENHAGKRPQIGRCSVLGADDNLWRSILARLDLSREVVVGPTAVSEITNLELQIFTEFRASTFSTVFLNLMLDLAGVKEVKVQERDPENLLKLVVTLMVVSLPSLFLFGQLLLDTHLLTLLELLAVL